MSQKISSPSHSNSSSSSKHDSRQDSWEIVEGLRGGLSNIQEPEKQAGYMLKKRKWPMKGWHKRFFYLDKGILKYAKCAADVEKGKLHGCIDVGLSVMAIKKKAKCIDLDAEENIYHLKIKSQELFDEWVSKLRHHRLYRQNEIAMFPHEKTLFHPHYPPTSSPTIPDTSFTVPSCISAGSIRLHASNPNLSSVDLTNEKTYHEPLDSPVDVSKLQEDFCRVANNREFCHSKLVLVMYLFIRMMHLIILPQFLHFCHVSICWLLLQAVTQNAELRERLCKIHAESHISEPSVHINLSPGPLQVGLGYVLSLVPLSVSNESRASITESLSEFFDAQEVLLSASSSENEPSDDDSYISDISDNVSMENFSNEVENERLDTGGTNGGSQEQRRSCLPSPSPNTSNISLWNILKNNIGKDLSKVAMPVQLNEPLNTLQRLCEELEYSELLDKAAHTQDPFERMVYIATFAVSGYASSHYRAGGKPFNPVLGETYECDRPDKGFRYVAEQVSHHPPISACHAESKNYIFWQDVRWRNKFWGKSMEIVPVGTTHVVLPGFGDHYEWNKVTSCIHNILSGQRWIEHYGEISIKNSNSEKCQCKVTFIKAKYWNSSMNEVEGAVTDHKGKVVHKLFGKWHEGMYCGSPPSATCIWRTNPMPPDYEQYYGFTKFAMELNELDPLTKPLLPPTDTRLRFDQRLLEEGNIESAEMQKQRIEQLQRERRRVLEENHMTHQPRFFQKSKDDTWVSNNTYWELRKDPGFSNLDCPVLW
uniref:Oxysterol-binding protein n=1 Tax=Cyprinus carpio TaxID=7962 RepID=A0A8C2CL41_CYPCA